MTTHIIYNGKIGTDRFRVYFNSGLVLYHFWPITFTRWVDRKKTFECAGSWFHLEDRGRWGSSEWNPTFAYWVPPAILTEVEDYLRDIMSAVPYQLDIYLRGRSASSPTSSPGSAPPQTMQPGEETLRF
jgi:hypothetical protein